jgi:hypothetical protein
VGREREKLMTKTVEEILQGFLQRTSLECPDNCLFCAYDPEEITKTVEELQENGHLK